MERCEETAGLLSKYYHVMKWWIDCADLTRARRLVASVRLQNHPAPMPGAARTTVKIGVKEGQLIMAHTRGSAEYAHHPPHPKS